MPGSRRPTQRELNALFGDYLSHNVLLGHFFPRLTAPLHMYHGFWFVSLWDSCVFEYMCFFFCVCFLYFLCLFSLFVYLVGFHFVFLFYCISILYLPAFFFYYSIFRCLGILFVFVTIMGQCKVNILNITKQKLIFK